MKRKACLTSLVFVALLIGCSALAFADGPVARLIPGGTVSMIADGRQVNQFKSEVPLPDGLLMVGEGSCVVQTSGLQLMIRDKSIFALSEGQKSWDLTVKKGHVDFALRAYAKPVTFSTPHDVIETTQALVNASSSGLVRGYLEVTETETSLVVTDGALRAVGANGSQLIEPGHGIRLAIANPPGVSNPPGDDKPPAGGAKPPAKGAGPPNWMPFAVVGGLGAGGGTAAYFASQGGGGGGEISPP